MIKRYSFVFSLLLLATWGLAQQTLDGGKNYYNEQKGIIYDKEFTVDLKLHTHGYALGVNIAKIKTYYLTQFYNIEFGELKHPREFRQSFDFQVPSTNQVSRAFVFGKQNNFFVLRGGFGEKRYFSEKAKRKGLAVGISYSGGPSIGFLKPYYLDLLRISDDEAGNLFIRSERFSDANRDTFLDIRSIFGSSGFGKGLSEISVIPGANFKIAAHFDWGAFDEFVKAIEIGAMVDFYFQNVPIMVESPEVPNVENRPFFVNLFVSLQLGKRY
ncbi:MAG: hypothetical protein AAF798_22890 [Bacteroidota bacterium]